VLAGSDRLFDGLHARLGDEGVEVDGEALVGQRLVEVGGVVLDAVFVGELLQRGLVAADDHDVDLLAGPVGEHHPTLVADGEERPHEVLAVAHPSGGAVDDNAQGLL
jgi:hypothetical protein